jgi:hypothetical protein
MEHSGRFQDDRGGIHDAPRIGEGERRAHILVEKAGE